MEQPEVLFMMSCCHGDAHRRRATGAIPALASMLLWALLCWAPASGAVQEPEAVVEETANGVLRAVVQRREELRQNPEALHRLVEEHLLPRVDEDYVARQVLAVHWRRASPEQRERFRQVFRRYLVRTYAEGLLEVSDERVQVLPRRGRADPRYTIVRTRLIRGDAPPISVDYALRRTDQGWQVFDVIIEGVSYVATYRNMFSGEINRAGLDALIERLERDGEGNGAPATGF